MTSTTLSTRLSKDEVMQLDFLARESGLDRAQLMKVLLRRGMRDLKMELAVTAYAEERVTLSRAAEMAGVRLREFLARLPANRLELHYGLEDFEADRKAFGG